MLYLNKNRECNKKIMEPIIYEMKAEDVVAFVKLCNANGIEVVIDGGWAVDALLGKQSRVHEDLDIAVLHEDVPKLRALLEARGYVDVLRDDTRDCNFVLGDDEGRLIDFHSCTFDADGKNIFGVPYPLASWAGHGEIGGFPVRCIEAQWLVDFHTGYELDEGDFHDVTLLCKKFGIKIPDEYDRFVTND